MNRWTLSLILLLPLVALAGRVVPPDPFERDNNPYLQQYTPLIDGEPQLHWFHVPGDSDWYVLNAYQGESNIIDVVELVPVGRGNALLALNVKVFDAADYCFFPFPGRACNNTPLIERNPCSPRNGAQAGDAVEPISLNARTGLIASTVYVVVRDCLDFVGDEATYEIMLRDRGLVPPIDTFRFLAAKITGTVTQQPGNQPVGAVILADGQFVGFSNPVNGQFALFTLSGPGPFVLQADVQYFNTLSVAPAVIGPLADSQVLSGVEIVVGVGDGVFAQGFEF